MKNGPDDLGLTNSDYNSIMNAVERDFQEKSALGAGRTHLTRCFVHIIVNKITSGEWTIDASGQINKK
jgi:hypothetical protein